MDERHLGTLLRCDPNDTDIEIPLDIYNSEEVLIGRDSTW